MPNKPFKISVMSFGYKHGLPDKSDFVFDVRFLPNPYYRPSLQPLSGNDEAVRRYVLKQPQAKKFLKLFLPVLSFIARQFRQKGKKRHLMLAIGCTGGRHRSIVMANEAARFLLQEKYQVSVKHRDIRR